MPLMHAFVQQVLIAVKMHDGFPAYVQNRPVVTGPVTVETRIAPMIARRRSFIS
jgi:hypothetical protein